MITMQGFSTELARNSYLFIFGPRVSARDIASYILLILLLFSLCPSITLTKVANI